MLEPAGQWGEAPGRSYIPWSSGGAVLAAGQTPRRPAVGHSIGYSLCRFIVVAPAVDHSVAQLPHSNTRLVKRGSSVTSQHQDVGSPSGSATCRCVMAG